MVMQAKNRMYVLNNPSATQLLDVQKTYFVERGLQHA